jgi:hypothetical protein
MPREFTFGIGLRQTGDNIDLQIAGVNDEVGGIKLIGRGPTQGLEFDAATGLLTAPRATNVAAGTIIEPPDDAKQYARMFDATTGGSWVASAATKSLVPVGRSPINGLDSGFDPVMQVETIFVPLATDALAGSIVEPPNDGLQYARTFDAINGGGWEQVVSGGVLINDQPPAAAAPGQLWWDSDSGDLFVRYQDVDSTAWVQINVVAPAPAIADDAPTDGQQYARQSSAWSVIAPGAAPIDAYTKAESNARYLSLVGGGTIGGETTPAIQLNKIAGNGWCLLQSADAGLLRWEINILDSNGNYVLKRYDDAGVISTSVYGVSRATGVVDFAVAPTVAGAPIVLASDLTARDERITKLEERLARLEAR